VEDLKEIQVFYSLYVRYEVSVIFQPKYLLKK